MICFDKETEQGSSTGSAKILINTMYLPFIDENIYMSFGDIGVDIYVKEINGRMISSFVQCNCHSQSSSSSRSHELLLEEPDSKVEETPQNSGGDEESEEEIQNLEGKEENVGDSNGLALEEGENLKERADVSPNADDISMENNLQEGFMIESTSNHTQTV